ncbi:hypothetical protein JXJ21_08230 [candidate division KSB1 bacterium]|nr:hypothetical protein [candidate division KSB1 bacterium]
MKIVKVKCNGTDQHINEIDLDKVLKRDWILKGVRSSKPAEHASKYMDIPERIVLSCKLCTGKVILTREQIKKTLESH